MKYYSTALTESRLSVNRIQSNTIILTYLSIQETAGMTAINKPFLN